MSPRKKLPPKVVLPERKTAPLNSLVEPSHKLAVQKWARRNGMTDSAAVRYMTMNFLDSIKMVGE